MTVGESFETPSSLITYGQRDGRPVVLKIVKAPSDEWHSGQLVAAFDGRGTVRVLEYVDGALLLERLDPGTSLVELTLGGRDEDATAILTDVIGAMSASRSVVTCPNVEDWGKGFARYVATGDDQVPLDLVAHADRLYANLCASQRNPRLLHGDLQHSNVLFDRHRGWVAIDPKGVIGEIEYEVGAALRNPAERPDLFANSAIIERRITQLAAMLRLDLARALAWAFAQAVLSAIWEVEDGHAVEPMNASLRLADAIRAML